MGPGPNRGFLTRRPGSGTLYGVIFIDSRSCVGTQGGPRAWAWTQGLDPGPGPRAWTQAWTQGLDPGPGPWAWGWTQDPGPGPRPETLGRSHAGGPTASGPMVPGPGTMGPKAIGPWDHGARSHQAPGPWGWRLSGLWPGTGPRVPVLGLGPESPAWDRAQGPQPMGPGPGSPAHGTSPRVAGLGPGPGSPARGAWLIGNG